MQFRVLTELISEADFNADGLVDSSDLSLWESAYGLTDVGDADGDSDTDGTDFLIWQQQFAGAALSAASTQVPEPTGMALALAAGFSLAGNMLWGRRADWFRSTPTISP